MTRQILCVMLMLTATAAAQERRPATIDQLALELQRAQIEGRLRATGEIRPTTGAPYSAEAATEFVQQLADGNRIARKTVVRIYRDSEGRVRREHLAADGMRVETVTITDGRGGVMLDPQAKIAYQEPGTVTCSMDRPHDNHVALREVERKKLVELHRRTATQAAPGSASGDIGPKTPAPLESPVTRIDLGERTVEGVAARGSRTTTIIPAGSIGNEAPIRILSEEWFSPDL